MMIEGTIDPITIREIDIKVEVILATDPIVKMMIMGAGAILTIEGVMTEVLDQNSFLRIIEKTEIGPIKTIKTKTVTEVVKTIGLVISGVANLEVRNSSSPAEEEAVHFVVDQTREEELVANFRDNLSNRWLQKAESYQSRLTCFE